MGYSSDLKHYSTDIDLNAISKESFSDAEGEIKGCGWALARHQVTWKSLFLVMANASENKYVTEVGTVQIVTYHINCQMLRTQSPNVGFSHGWLCKTISLHSALEGLKCLKLIYEKTLLIVSAEV
jgi:hypothetical protein